jgi:hypothetical protein
LKKPKVNQDALVVTTKSIDEIAIKHNPVDNNTKVSSGQGDVEGEEGNAPKEKEEVTKKPSKSISSRTPCNTLHWANLRPVMQ